MDASAPALRGAHGVVGRSDISNGRIHVLAEIGRHTNPARRSLGDGGVGHARHHRSHIRPTSQSAAASTFTSGQVFASVGQSTVNVYDPTSGNQLGSLTDRTGEPYVAGTAWDAQGNLYVADDTNVRRR